MNFLTGAFAVAGLVAALGPILIHLLNRRRFRVERWAAMDFLRAALQRSRKLLRIRDLLLLALRVVAIACFGLALARPYFSSVGRELIAGYAGLGALLLAGFGLLIWATVSQGVWITRLGGVLGITLLGTSAWAGYQLEDRRQSLAADGVGQRSPVHAIVMIDNSRSMRRTTLAGSLLDRAQARATEYIAELPRGSRITVIPLCGTRKVVSEDAYVSPESAIEAVNLIEPVDRALSLPIAFERAEGAAEQVPELTAKRTVVFSDLQEQDWRTGAVNELFTRVPDLQLVAIGSDEPLDPANIWVADIELVEGVAGRSTRSTFIADIRCEGPEPVSDVNVTLFVDGRSILTKTVSLEPGQRLEVPFEHQFDESAGDSEVDFHTVGVSVEVPGPAVDQLEADNTREITIPLVGNVGVVFVDEKGPSESPGDRGTTYRLRGLAEQINGDAPTDRLIDIRHVTITELDREILANARMVVIAGVTAPTPESVAVLREFVRQGGRLLILTGGEFDPEAWTETAWNDGRGILPLPLKPELLGTELTETAVRTGRDFRAEHLDFESTANSVFLIPGESEEVLKRLYGEPTFYRFAAPIDGDETLETWEEATRKAFTQRREAIIESDTRRSRWAELERLGQMTDEEKIARAEDEQTRRRLEPAWVSWNADKPRTPTPTDDEAAERELEQSLRTERPQVLARFLESGHPAFVRRRLGGGEIVFFSGGTANSWTNLFRTNAVLVFERLLRTGLDGTFSDRNFPTGTQVRFPVRDRRDRRFSLIRPTGESNPSATPATEDLPIQAFGPQEFGIVIEQPFDAGRYEITETIRPLDPTGSPGENAAEEQVRKFAFTTQAPERESNLAPIERETFDKLTAELTNVAWIGENDPIPVEGATIRHRDLWKTLAMIVLVALLLEMLVLAAPNLRKPTATEGAA